MLLYVNHGFELLTGYSAGEVLGQNMRFLQGADTDRVAVDRMRAAIELEQEFTTELLNYRKDGTPFWNQISITPVKDAAGKVGHFVAVLHDATDRKQAVEAHRRLALIVESSDDAIIAKTLEGTVLTWNAGRSGSMAIPPRRSWAVPSRSWCRRSPLTNCRRFSRGSGEGNGSHTTKPPGSGTTAGAFRYL